MKYVSTRGGVEPVSFRDAVMFGQANDGGLYMPDHIPIVRDHLESWRKLNFSELATEIASIYAPDICRERMSKLFNDAFSTFDSREVTPLVKVGDLYVLELFHGPTLAFKDIALQVLGRLFELVLEEQDSKLNILGATSGDTGSAAIAGVEGSSRIRIFILFPDGRTSALQELQMTSIQSQNVHCIGVEGSFDDCQQIMKSIFGDVEFKSRYHLGAVNSINWARVMVQIVYYFYASLKFDRPVTFSVPTGNFGNILSGILAQRMGAPIDRFVLGTNENDILFKFFKSGQYQLGKVRATISPSMDIQVASNLERYLYLLMDSDGERVNRFMDGFMNSGFVEVGGGNFADPTIISRRVNTEQSLKTIRETWKESRYIVDPHTAVGLAAAKSISGNAQTVCLATAHPAKFPDAVAQATGGSPPTHPTLLALDKTKARKVVLTANEQSVREYLLEVITGC
ncbi:MAG: threonine synthase [Gammaproteobacteria bacterium]|nr:threonine synthase [Gammaproteobacteria bacterium]